MGLPDPSQAHEEVGQRLPGHRRPTADAIQQAVGLAAGTSATGPGGNVSITHQVSNYPGFIAPQPGFMLSHFMAEQAKEAGAEFRQAVDITSVDLHKKEIVVDGLNGLG